MSVKLLRLPLFFLPVLALTACGEGWEAQKTDTYFPYGNERTAGYGVVYVRAKMMPEKELKVEPVTEVVEETPAEPPAPIEPADEVFNDAQTKGGAPVNRSSIPSGDTIEEKHSSVTQGADIDDATASVSSEIEVASGFESDVEAHMVEAGSAEAYIAQAPKRIEVPEVKIIDDAVDDVIADEVGTVAVVAPPPPQDMPYQTHNRTLVEQIAERGDQDVERHVERVETEAKEIISPKKDFFQDVSVRGYSTLEEIYSDPF